MRENLDNGGDRNLNKINTHSNQNREITDNYQILPYLYIYFSKEIKEEKRKN